MESSYIIHKKIIPIIKSIIGVKDLSLFRRKLKQRIEKLFYKKTYTSDDIIDIMKSMGLKKGSNVIVHCAMNNFYNYRGTVQELIDKILNTIGETGTLCMPCYPYNKYDESKIFDVKNDVTAAGLLAETFRKMPGVKRSVCKEHSVCAIGPMADFLLSEHVISTIRYDEHSPYFKLGEINGISFSLGLPKYYIGTIVHVSEALLASSFTFFKNKFIGKKTYKFIDLEGNMGQQTLLSTSKQPYIRKLNSKLIEKYFDPLKYNKKRLSNIWINMYDVSYTIRKLTELGKEGKTIYRTPKWIN